MTTGWTLRRILKRLGLPKARYHDWKERAARNRLADLRAVGLCYREILPEEKEAVIAYALTHPKDGYRRLCWQMVDEDSGVCEPFLACTGSWTTSTSCTGGSAARGTGSRRPGRRSRTSGGTWTCI